MPRRGRVGRVMGTHTVRNGRANIYVLIARKLQ